MHFSLVMPTRRTTSWNLKKISTSWFLREGTSLLPMSVFDDFFQQIYFSAICWSFVFGQFCVLLCFCTVYEWMHWTIDSIAIWWNLESKVTYKDPWRCPRKHMHCGTYCKDCQLVAWGQIYWLWQCHPDISMLIFPILLYCVTCLPVINWQIIVSREFWHVMN